MDYLKAFITKLQNLDRSRRTDTVFKDFLTLCTCSLAQPFYRSDEIEQKYLTTINEYTKESYYGDINKWLRDFTINSFEEVSYFTSRLMYSLNNYASDNNKYCQKNDKTLYRGTQINYSSLLAYERAIGKIIVISSFTSSSENKNVAIDFSGRDNNNIDGGIFSVIFYITNKWEKNWISNGIDIKDISDFQDGDEKEDEVLFQPFSFYYVNDVKFDLKKHYVDIYLETVGKTEILERALHDGKKIEYIENNNLRMIKVCK